MPTSKAAPPVEPALVDIKWVTGTLGCSRKHVERMCDAWDMPRPVRLGKLVKWRRAEIAAWIAAGCPSGVASVDE